jgi:hypothetical protein
MLALKRFEVEFVDKVRVVVYIAEFVEVIIDVLVGSQKVSSRKPDRDVLARPRSEDTLIPVPPLCK